MILIFALGRGDVVSWGDLAIRRGMTRLYGLETLTRDEFLRYRRRYSPYGSVASLYLWARGGGAVMRRMVEGIVSAASA